jgi:hypothetical protein
MITHKEEGYTSNFLNHIKEYPRTKYLGEVTDILKDKQGL